MRDILPSRDLRHSRDLLDVLLAGHPRFVDMAHRILKCRARAEDVVQDVALALCQDRAIPEMRHPEAYIGRMIRNLAIDSLRRTGFECRLLAPIAAAEQAASPCDCPQEQLEACQALRAVAAALDRAPPRARHALLAHRLDGVPQKEIAAQIGVSPARVNGMIKDATVLCRRACGALPERDAAAAGAWAAVA